MAARPAPSRDFPERKPVPAWLTVLLLVVFFPAGLPLMWIRSGWSVPVKAAVNAVFSVALIASVLLNIARPAYSPAAANALPEAASSSETTGTTEAAYKASCQAVAYTELIRSPDQYYKKNVKITVKIDSIEQYDAEYDCLALASRDEYNSWHDFIHIGYVPPSGSPLLKKGDLVTVYGKVLGTRSYSYHLDLPYIRAPYAAIQ